MSAAAGAVPGVPARRAGVAFAALAAVQVAVIASITMLTVALPQLRRQWGLSSPALVVVSASYGVAFGSLLLVAGGVADRVGYRRTLLGALAGFTAAALAAAGANGPVALVAARFGQGAGAAFAVPAAIGLIPAVFADERRRARATAVWGVLAATGAGAGMVLSGVVVQASWRWLFAPPALVAVVAAGTVSRLVPAGPAIPGDRSGAAVGPLGGVLMVAGLAALIYGLGAESVPVAAVGVPLLLGFAVARRRSAAPPLPGLTAPAASGLLAILVAAGAMASLYYLLTLRLAAAGDSPARISVAFIPPALAGLAAGPAAARLLGRFPARAVLACALAAAAAGLLLIGRGDPGAAGRYSGLGLVGLVTFPAGTAIALSAATVLAMAGADGARRGSVGGLTNTAMEIGPPLMLALAAPLAHAHGDGPTFLAMAALLAVAIPVTLLATRGRHRRDPAATALSIPQDLSTVEEHPIMTARFDGKVVLITGGAGAIAGVTAQAFADLGATVVLAGRDPDKLATSAGRIRPGTGKIDWVTADVTDGEQVAAMVAEVVHRHGGLHVAFNNAGIFGAGVPVADLDEDTWRAVLDVNVTGVFLSMKHEIAHMRGNGGGAIVNMASNIGAHGRRPGLAAYAASKAAVSVLTRAAARDHIGDGIRVNAVSPGATDTPMSYRPGETRAERDARIAAATPAGRVGEPAEVAAAVVWLASEDASFVVGHDLVADGGVTA